MGEVDDILIQQQVLVAPVATPQGRQKPAARAGQVPGPDQLVADPVEVLERALHHRVGPLPAPARQVGKIGSEDLVEPLVQKPPLLLLIQQAEARLQAHPLRIRGQEPTAQAVDGADARAPEVAVVSCRPAHCVQPLTQLPGRVRVVGAQEQLAGFGFAQQQDVGSAQRHRQRLAGAGSRDAQHRSLQSPDQLPLAGVQPRVESQDGGRDARFIGHVDFAPELIHGI